jgi:two-component system, OmpR family, alkaline phosphatase synthesis response regulator PhoP
MGTKRDKNIMFKILLIDDEKALLENTSLSLESAGYNVVMANNGKEGIRKLDELSFDMVITDFFMPICKGDEVARHVHNLGKNIPVVCITGSPLNFDQSCFDLVINKPFRFEALIKSIKEILNTKE